MKARLLMLLMALSLTGYGQSQFSGRVTDDQGESLPGVSILIKGSTNGVTSDTDGRFTLQQLPSDAVLVVSFIGYVTQEISVAGRTSIEIKLVTDLTTLDEVVIIGYGTSTAKELTGSVTLARGTDAETMNNPNVMQALQGKLPGVQIAANSGSPGSNVSIRIRGITTNGDNNPLILVDGIQYSPEGLNALSPSDIESYTVLKDAIAGIYGVRAANGVIIVTTKQGKRNSKPTLEYNSYYGVQQTMKKLDVLDATEFAILKNEMYAAAGLPAPYANTNLGKGTDWQDKVFESSPIQNHSLTLTGGTDKNTYSLGGAYFKQDGIVGGDKAHYERINARLNFTTDILQNLTLQNVLMYTNEKRNSLSENVISSVLYNAINASPIASVKTDNRYTYLDEVNDLINPVAQIANTFNDFTGNKIFGKQELQYKINGNFDLTGRAGYSYWIGDSKSFSPLVYYGAGKPQNTAINEDLDPVITTIGGLPTAVENSVSESRQTSFDYTLEAFLNYNRTFGQDHKVKGTLGTSFINTENKGLGGTAFNVPYNSYTYADISLTDGANLMNNVSSYQTIQRIQSFFLRGEYGFKGRYLVSAAIRRDASTNFGPNKRFGYFPSASAAWIISEEGFFNSSLLDFIKFRGSYGVIGNDKIGLYAWRALLGGEAVYPFNDQLVTGRAAGLLGNPDLKWETVHQSNIGFDISLLQSKLSITTDYYIKKTKDLLYQPEISGVLGTAGAGAAPPFVNGGDVRNRGFEFLIEFADKIGNDFSYTIGYNVTTISNEITAMPIAFRDNGSFSVGGGAASREQVGQSFGAFYGYQTIGVYQNTEQIAERNVTQDGAVPGDLIYKDRNKNGRIDLGDRTFIGNPIPKAIMGINLGASFKGFDFSAALYASVGNEILRNYERQQPLANMLDYRIERWTGQGSTNEHPRITAGTNGNNVLSDYFIEDGSYLRIRNIQLGYSLPSELISKAKLRKLRVYLAVNNLATFTKYKGFDPDFISPNPLNNGVDMGYYPQARTFMGGLNITF